MSSGKVKCTCGWSWNKSDSSKKDMYICHECGRDNSNNMKNGGWLDSYADGGTMQEHQENYNNPQVSLPEGFVGMGNNTKGRNYSPAWGGQFQMGGQAPKRRGVRYNEDGSVSTHLMKTETDGKGNWFSFPTLFQNSIPYADDSENWLDMSDRPWEEAYEEAKKRGEVINFGSDKDAAIKFGQGSWKDKKQMGGSVYPVNYVPEAQWGLPVGPFTPIAPLALSAANKVKSWWNDDEPVKPIKKPTTQGKPRTLNIVDPRKKMATTNQPLRPNSDLVGGKYNSNHLDKLMQEAKRQKLSKQDMMTLSAMGFQETKWGKSDGNIGHVIGNWKGNDHYQKFISAYKEKMKEADRLGIKDPATRLQVYNGMGTITPKTEKNYHGFEMQKIYGVPIPKGGINMKKNPLYGKQVMDIRDNVLAKNPEYLQYMDSIYKAPVPAYMQDVRMNKQKPPRFIIPPIGKKEMGGSIPGTVGFSYARTNDPAPDNGPGAKKTMASAQNGIKKPIPSYQDFLKSINKDKVINLREEPREIVRDNTRVVFRDEKGKQREVNPNKPIATTYNKAEREKALVAERKAKIADSIKAQDEDIIGNPNWREVLARETQATGDKFRLFPEEDSFIDNWLNPGVMIGNMASGLGQAPYQAEQTDSYMPYVTAIGTPLAVGALAGFGANSNSQFVNNLVNPLAGINPLTGLKNTVKKIPYGETAIPFAWKSRANELGQIESQAMFDAIKQSEKLTEADKVLLAEYQFDSAPFTGTGFGSSPEKRAALQKIIDKVNPEFQSNTVLTRRMNADNAAFFNNENGIIRIGDRPTSFSAGIGADANFGKDRFVLSGQNAKAVESNFLKNPYEELAPQTIDDLQNFTDVTHPGFTGKPQVYTNYKGEVMTNMPLTENSGFVNELNQTAIEKELIGSGFDFKQLGKVKNDLGGYDYIVKPTNIQNRNIFNETPIQRQGFPNPLSIVDRVVPRPPTPGMLLGMEDSWNNYSPFNLIPGYGEKLSARSSYPNFVGFRKFGNSIQDVIESQSLRPKGTGMGSKQIMSEGNWAEPGKVNENYSGVFEATMNPQIQGSNIKLEKWNKRNGIVGTTQEGDVAIPLTDTGLSFNRRLPFSNRYVPIDKEKLINNQFQLSTQLPHLQSLVEKYGLWAGGAGAAGYFTGGSEGAKENINTLNKYTIDPLIDFTKPYYNKAEEEFNRQTGNKKDGGVIKDDMGYWNPDNWGKDVEIDQSDPNSFIDMEGVYEPLLGVSDKGERRIMYPGEKHKFKKGTKKVTESRIAKNGLRQEQKGLVNLDQLTNFTNYNTKQPGGWLDKY